MEFRQLLLAVDAGLATGTNRPALTGQPAYPSAIAIGAKHMAAENGHLQCLKL
ncbi:hypothetical protein [Salinisphaera sp. G21_0]|uniref:hypothetical protein n=1 Tax=Salinisphaera sp. G21_0 TaxID=2821094 RepID=UPI001ADB38C6|nr:hypothetical protein [Salinisphaera sp. G21_0]MBO9483440.1 hypothetical protein [Salinisphaera sp. G21_0]